MSMPGWSGDCRQPARSSQREQYEEVVMLKGPRLSTVMIRCETPSCFAIETATASVTGRDRAQRNAPGLGRLRGPTS